MFGPVMMWMRSSGMPAALSSAGSAGPAGERLDDRMAPGFDTHNAIGAKKGADVAAFDGNCCQ